MGRNSMGSARSIACLTAVLAHLAMALAQNTYTPTNTNTSKPNFVVVLADDLDYQMGSTVRNFMPNLHSLIGDHGLELRNFVVSMAWCCPSRASLLTGKHVHNTNVTSSSAPRGGASAFLNSKFTNNYLPVWLQNLGYNTYFTGKFLNLMPVVDQATCPKGWTLFEGMLDSYNSSYSHWYTRSYYSNNCSGIQTYDKYQTYIMRDKGKQYIDHAVADNKPFYIQLSPVAPHDQGFGKEAVPAADDVYAFQGAGLPRSPNWGVRLPDLMYLSNAKVDFSWSSKKWLRRVRSLKAVDDMIAVLVDKLSSTGQLDNTYFIFTSDNGFHLGHHGIQYEKFTPYEEDVRVPFFIRGPGVPDGVKTDYQGTMVDVTATVLHLAGGKLTREQDGVPLPFLGITQGLAGPIIQLQRPPPSPPSAPPAPPGDSQSTTSYSNNNNNNNKAKSPKPPRPPPEPVIVFPAPCESDTPQTWNETSSSWPDMVYTVRDSILIEGWLDMMDPKLARKDYRAVRVCTKWLLPTSNATSGTYLGPYTCYKYTVWCIPKNPFTGQDTRFRELYDLGADPYELNNLLPAWNDDTNRLVTRLNAVLTVLAYCEGATCRQPWVVLHPDGSVLSLEQAMDPHYDSIYSTYTSFGYRRCTVYYNPDNEVADPTILQGLQDTMIALGGNA